MVTLVADPRVEIELTLPYERFSPNGNGRQDLLFFRPQLRGFGGELLDWRLTISNSEGAPVRYLRADQRMLRAPRRLGNLFSYDPLRPAPLELPERFWWDGRSESGVALPSGSYTARLTLRSARDRRDYHSDAIDFDLQLEPPEIELTALRSYLVRPFDAEGRLDLPQGSIRLQQHSRGVRRAAAEIRSADGSVVERRSWQGTPSQEVLWNGFDERNRPLPPGSYSYHLTVEDGAGNRREAVLRDLQIAAGMAPLFDLRPLRYSFAPRLSEGGVAATSLSFEVTAPSGQRMVEAWRFEVARQPGATPLYRFSGEGVLPGRIEWSGLDGSGSPYRDGLYYVQLIIERGGAELATTPRPFLIDRSVPEIQLSTAERPLRLLADGAAELALITIATRDASEVERWHLELSVVPELDLELEQPLMRWSGAGAPPEQLWWSGLGTDGQRSESFERYRLRLSVVDAAGNASLVEGQLRSGLLLRPRASGSSALLASIPIQRFFDYEGELRRGGRELLATIFQELADYPLYRFSFEVHSGQVGREEENLARSELFAWSLFRELRRLGVEVGRLRYIGLGESEPLFADERGPFERYRNERIELKLEVVQ